MGFVRKVEDDDSSSSPSSSSLNEALLIATMCIIGLQVHVHVRDGSVFSGIFYTASFDNDFGIVLKNAKITKKGTSKANVASGSVVETLVILSANIVQIVAEGVSLPSNVKGTNDGENVESAAKALPSSEPHLSTPDKSKTFCVEGRFNHHKRRHAGPQILKRSEQIPGQENNIDILSSSSSLDSMSERVKPVEEDKLTREPDSNGFHHAAERPSSTDYSSSQSTTVDETSELCQDIVASVPIQAVKKAKEFKLNPEAKIFSPSYTKRILSPAPSGVPDGNIPYIPSNASMLPVRETVYTDAVNNPYMPQSFPPPKFVPYGNLPAGNVVGGFPQHMIGPTLNRAQPQRFISQYQPIQVPPIFVNPNPQVMIAGTGQLVYNQPMSQEMVRGLPPLTPMLSHPLPTAQHVQYMKHPGVVAAAGQPLPLCVSQPFPVGGMQPYSVPVNQFPVMQPPFPTNQPMAVGVPNGFFGAKFQ